MSTTAKKNQESAPTDAAAAQQPAKVMMPEGFQDESRPDLDGWVRPASDLVVSGKITGAFSFSQRERDGSSRIREVVTLKLLVPMPGFDEDKQPVIYPIGAVVGLSLNTATDNVRYYVESQGVVWIRFTGKDDIGGGQSVWKAEVGCRGRKSERPWKASALPQRRDTVEANGDTLPF